MHSFKKFENDIALEVSNLDKSIDSIFLQNANIPEKFSTFEVTKFDRSIDFKTLHPLNIFDISLTFFVSNDFISKVNSLVQLWNIFAIF